MTSWSTSDIVGPDGEDWRVPVSELAARQTRLAEMLAEANLPGALIQHPVDLYYYAGGRQDGSLFVPAEGAGGSEASGGDGPVAFVRRSLKRAVWEAGGDDAPHIIEAFPRLSTFAECLGSKGVNGAPALQFGEAPGTFTARFASPLSSLGACGDATAVIHRQREVKSAWELEQMDIGASVQIRMFEAVLAVGGEGMSELDMVAAAEAISRSEGFGGNVQMRRYPLQCDRGVIVAGRAAVDVDAAVHLSRIERPVADPQEGDAALLFVGLLEQRVQHLQRHVLRVLRQTDLVQHDAADHVRVVVLQLRLLGSSEHRRNL